MSLFRLPYYALLLVAAMLHYDMHGAACLLMLII